MTCFNCLEGWRAGSCLCCILQQLDMFNDQWNAVWCCCDCCCIVIVFKSIRYQIRDGFLLLGYTPITYVSVLHTSGPSWSYKWHTATNSVSRASESSRTLSSLIINHDWLTQSNAFIKRRSKKICVAIFNCLVYLSSSFRVSEFVQCFSNLYHNTI